MTTDLSPFARLALDCVAREFPNQTSLLLRSEADLRLPRAATPCFFGCFDWHSAVHSHWVLARVLATGTAGDLAAEAKAALARSIAAENVEAEIRHLRPRPAFERPYGLAWLLMLETELRVGRPAIAETLAPLAAVARAHLADWLPKLTHPVRTGVHNQTAFALGLVLDHARTDGHESFAALALERSRAWFGADRDYPLHLEPSGEDFLSPSLAAADLMRRILDPDGFAEWLDRTIPAFSATDLPPAEVADRTDGRLAHLDGLNLSRAWMLGGIASGLPEDDVRRPALLDAAVKHRAAGIAAVTDEHYEIAHWLGSFAVYLLTESGLR